MSTYIGAVLVTAKPMTRQAYNDLRGWEVPSNENPSDEGYLVESHDAGQANVAGFNGYVSWSPKDVFERVYRAVGEPAPAKPKHKVYSWRDVEHHELATDWTTDRLKYLVKMKDDAQFMGSVNPHDVAHQGRQAVAQAIVDDVNRQVREAADKP